MLITLSASAQGSLAPPQVPPTQTVTNGDFTIKSNAPIAPLITGDGVDDHILWDFDLKTDVDWVNVPLSNVVVKAARLQMTIFPKNPLITTDIVKIANPAFGDIVSNQIQGAQVNVISPVNLDLLEEGYTPSDILNLIQIQNGVIPMVYADDAIISFARIDITFEIQKECSKLCVEALSEDTIANPGNRRPNYLIVSVTDSCGNPVKGLDKNNFKVDALIVGPGGALVNITGLQESNRIDGYYFLDLKPIRREKWKAGVYIFGVAVDANGQKGQTLASVLMD